jgi:hypothetical protein
MTFVTSRRRLSMASAVAGASASVALLVAACGGSTGGPSGGATSAPAVSPTATPTAITLTITDFVSNANMVCLNASQYATSAPTPVPTISSFAHPAVSELPTIATYFTSLIGLYQGMYSQLQSLGAPPSNASQWSQALTEYQAVMTDFQAAQAAATSSDLSGYTTALAKEQADNTTAAATFTRFGTTMCATDAEPTPV